MRVAVEKLPGVMEAEVSLEDGLVAIDLEPANEVTIADVRNAIRDQGFSPRAAEVRIAGRLEERESGVVLRVPGSGSAYTVTAPEEMRTRLREAIGEDVLLSGGIPRTDETEEPGTIEVIALEER